MPLMRPVLAAGELLWDLLPGGARLGGATANFAGNCARLGRPAALVSAVGRDELGQAALDQLKRTAADVPLATSLLQTDPTLPTGTVGVTLGPDGHPAYNIHAPVAWDRIRLTPESLHAAGTAAALYFGTLAQRDPVSRSTIRGLIDMSAPDCVRVFDVNVRIPFCTADVLLWSLHRATIVKISEEELELVTGSLHTPGLHLSGASTPIDELERAARAVLAAAPKLRLVAITMGPRGSLLVSPESSHYHPAFPVAVVDTVGAGDAFTAGLTCACLSGAGLPAMNEVGNLCGSFVAGQPGATPAFSPELLAKIRSVLQPAGL